MKPPYITIQVPERGVEWLPGSDFQGACEKIPDNAWDQWPTVRDLWIHTEGPSGSGRYWTVTVGVALERETKPSRGFCFTASTVGWRTLQQFSTPLRWADYRDRDGTPELAIWDSFPIATASTMAEWGLVAWVYGFETRDRFNIEWRRSREKAAELAASYRTKLPGGQQRVQALRNAAAQALTSFASGACSAETVSPRK